MEADVPAAAQISQADIIERQAESIVRLKRQVQKGIEYKQLTKSKLKEAAARLKEYRVRVETLGGEVETVKKQLKDATRSHDKTKQWHQNALKQEVKTIKRMANASTQTHVRNTVTRTSQTLLCGQVAPVIKLTMIDHGVQTVDVLVDTLTSKKRGRERGVATVHPEVDQFVPKLSRSPLQEIFMEDALTHKPLEVLDSVGERAVLQDSSATFLHETSAALDAALALSDLEDESAETGDLLEAKVSGQEDAREQYTGLSPSVLDIYKERETSSDEEEHDNGADAAGKNGHLLLDGVAQAVSNIEKKLGSSNEKSDGRRKRGAAQAAGNIDSSRIEGRNGLAADEKSGRSMGFDFAISNAIDKDLESSTDEEDSVNVGDSTNARKTEQSDAAKEDVFDVSQKSEWPLVSIDDELDDEFAALDADSDIQNRGKVESLSSSSSSENDSSDSSDSDSDNDGDDPVTGGGGNVSEKKPLGPVKEKGEVEKPALEAKVESKPEVWSPLLINSDAAVQTTSAEKKSAGASEYAYSPIVDAELAIHSLDRMHRETSAELMISATEKNPSSVAVDSLPIYAPKIVRSRIQLSGDVIADAVPDTQTSSDDTKSLEVSVPKQSALVTSSSRTNTRMKSEPDPTTSFNQPSDHVSLDFPVPPIDADKQSAGANQTDEQYASISRATEVSTIGRFRKADDANLEGSQVTSSKKLKLNNKAEAGTGVTIRETKSRATDEKKRSAVAAEGKEKLRWKRQLSSFKQAIGLSKDEEPDNAYTRRTIAVLVKRCSKFVGTHLVYMNILCRTLADVYREMEISPMLVLRESLGLFKTPRSRRLMQERKIGLSWLCNQVLTRVMCSSKEELEQDVSVTLKSFCLSMVDECLLHLRGLLVEERTNLGEFLSKDRVQGQATTRQNSVSHDKVFLAHICALYTHLCRSTGQLVRSRVLLFDLVRDNPNIKGLYFAMVMLEIYPAILECEFDQRCIERQVILKETLQQALVAISGVAAAKQELLLLQSSVTMLHAIADAIQMPQLNEVDGSDVSFRCACVEKLFNKFVNLCQSPKPGQPVNEVQSPVSADYFALAKSMEICTAVYGVDLVMKFFDIERCQQLFSKANVEDKVGIMYLVGHIAVGIASKTNGMNTSTTKSEEYVESVTTWMCHILSTDENSVPGDRFRLTFWCSAMCVELILEHSGSAGLQSRRRVLCAVVRWFDTMPTDQLINLPATFLRRLRLAVVAARPQVIPR